MGEFLRKCLIRSTRTVNLFLTFCGVGLIIYSLWLLKKWREGVAELVSPSTILKPWFVYTCLTFGIFVCFGMIMGHMVVNHMNYTILYVYIILVSSVCIIQIALIIVVFMKIDWNTKISKYIGPEHKSFENFWSFHVALCHSMAVVVLIAEINAVVLVVILWAVEPERRGTRDRSNIPEVNQSFLIRPNSPVNGDSPR